MDSLEASEMVVEARLGMSTLEIGFGDDVDQKCETLFLFDGNDFLTFIMTGGCKLHAWHGRELVPITFFFRVNEDMIANSIYRYFVGQSKLRGTKSSLPVNYEYQCHSAVINDLSFARLNAIRVYQPSPTTHAKSPDAKPVKVFY